jgi:class 3 adenylate cyclase/tetratricopeptide (TPR) repeat protein
MAICERCGTETPDEFRYCGACGAPMPEVTKPQLARKVVTVLFCDVTGSTALADQLDPEIVGRVVGRYFEQIRGIIERHGGTVEKFIGDAVMAVFGIPRVHEDDALRAVRAAADIRQRLPAVAEETGMSLRFRTGVNTGMVLSGGDKHLAVGDAVNVAARLEQAAQPGEILLGPETLRLVRDAVEVEPLEPLALKGKSSPVPAFRLLRVDPVAPGVARRLDRPLVGRERELRLLEDAWQRALDESACHLLTLLGVAGVGKSRLVAELLERVGDDATILSGRCLPYGETVTFWPLVEAFTAVGPRAATVVETMTSGTVAAPEELFLAVRRLLEELAAERPTILHIDDLHWAESMLLDLLDHVAELSRDAPILLVCTARPELLEHRPGWGGGKLGATTMLLQPLRAAECDALLDRLGGDLEPDVRARVISASEGNPLFLEEMAALAREDRSVSVPSTIHALLAARLEGLAGQDRELLERGAVEGEVFHRLAVRALAGERPVAEIETRLSGLVRSELIRPHPPTLRSDEAFRFRHLLIRDAAYDRLPKEVRARLHERFARWLGDHAEESVDLDEAAGWHLEQAVRYQRELGQPVDRMVMVTAARYLYNAGRRARDRSDVVAAAGRFERGFALAPEDDPLHLRIAVDLAEQLIEGGDLARADELLAAAERDPHMATLAGLGRLEWLTRVAPEEARQAIVTQMPGIMSELDRLGDERGLARACMLLRWIHRLASQATPAGEQARRAAEHASRAGDRALRSRALGSYVWALIYGDRSADAIAQEFAAIESHDEEPGVFLAASIKVGRGQLARFEGRMADARALTQCAIEDFRALGMPEMEAACEQDLARIELSAKHPQAALEALLRSDSILIQLGERARRSATQAHLAQAHERLGDPEAARAAIELAEELGTDEDVLNRIITHGVRARLALGDRNGQEAEHWARSAVELATGTDYAIFQAAARLDLAEVLYTLEQPDEARREAGTALELFAAKGDRVGSDDARAVLASR